MGVRAWSRGESDEKDDEDGDGDEGEDKNSRMAWESGGVISCADATSSLLGLVNHSTGVGPILLCKTIRLAYSLLMLPCKRPAALAK